MKKTIIAVVIIIIAIVGIVIFGKSPSSTNSPTAQLTSNNVTENTPAIPITETTKVSSKLLQYKNAELGFAVTYPNAWKAENTMSGVSFIVPIDQSQVTTLAKLQVDINVMGGKCAFPPVTTIKDRGTIKVGSNTLNMISMTNSVQGRSYFDRMYSLQQGEVCYVFSLSTITSAPSSKNLSGSNLAQAQNNNKALINTTDAEFTDLVKSFTVVTGPTGEDETKVAPVKK